MPDRDLGLQVRTYGGPGPTLVVLHGGPGAAGYMAPVARELADRYRVLEPLQRGGGSGPLTVARHVRDLHQVIAARCAAAPLLVGHSWGAMLALAYAAEYPSGAAALALVGCGTFDAVARQRLEVRLAERVADPVRQHLEALSSGDASDERLATIGRLLLVPYSHALVDGADLELRASARAHRETWQDMVRLQQRGVYPARFAAITAPVIMLHGADDPHPGPMIRASLRPHLPQLSYSELPRCGHYPWLEQHARARFFELLRRWIATAADQA